MLAGRVNQKIGTDIVFFFFIGNVDKLSISKICDETVIKIHEYFE